MLLLNLILLHTSLHANKAAKLLNFKFFHSRNIILIMNAKGKIEQSITDISFAGPFRGNLFSCISISGIRPSV